MLLLFLYQECGDFLLLFSKEQYDDDESRAAQFYPGITHAPDPAQWQNILALLCGWNYGVLTLILEKARVLAFSIRL